QELKGYRYINHFSIRVKSRGNEDSFHKLGLTRSLRKQGIWRPCAQGITGHGTAEDLQIAENGSFTIYGTLYAAGALMKITGNNSVSNIGSQDLSITGKSRPVLPVVQIFLAPRVLCPIVRMRDGE